MKWSFHLLCLEMDEINDVVLKQRVLKSLVNGLVTNEMSLVVDKRSIKMIFIDLLVVVVIINVIVKRSVRVPSPF